MANENEGLAVAAIAVVAVGLGIHVVSRARGSRSIDLAAIMANVKKPKKSKKTPKKTLRSTRSGLRAYLHFKHGSSDKFWFIRQAGASITQHWGRVGTQGQQQTWLLGSPSEASAEVKKRLAKKMESGYAKIPKRHAAKLPKRGLL